MIGHYLLAITVGMEDAILTTPLRPGAVVHPTGEKCLVGAATFAPDFRRIPLGWNPIGGIPVRYDDLCRRFGAPRVDNAIRARILDNRARRTLSLDTSVASQTVAV